MEEGIGRSGYRVLATLFYALGLLSSLVSLDAYGPSTGYEWLAFGLGLGCITLLWALAMLALTGPARPRPAKAPLARPAKPAPRATASAPAAKPAARDIDFEFAAKKAPERLVLPPAFQEPQTDPKAWPDRRTTRITRGEMAKKYTQRAPMMREILSNSGSTVQVPEMIAIPGHARNGMDRGKCGGCGMMLAAPPERPIRLRCPGCGKGTLLQ